MTNQVIPITGVADVGVIKDTPEVALPPNAFSDAKNVRFRDGAVQKMEGEVLLNTLQYATHLLPTGHRFGNMKHIAWWPAPNIAPLAGYFIVAVEYLDTDDALVGHKVLLQKHAVEDSEDWIDLTPASLTEGFDLEGDWQHTFFQGGFAVVLNNGVDIPHYILDPSGNEEITNLVLAELPGWESYNVNQQLVEDTFDEDTHSRVFDVGQLVDYDVFNIVVNVDDTATTFDTDTEISNITTSRDPNTNTTIVTFTETSLADGNEVSIVIRSLDPVTVSAKVIRSFGDFLVAGDITERDTDQRVVRRLAGVVRTSDAAAPGSIPNNWNPFAVGVSTADEFVITADGVVVDMAELQGNMFIYSNSSISQMSPTGNDQVPLSVVPITDSYGCQVTNGLIEYDGKHVVIGSSDIYLFAGHPGNIQSVSDGRIRRYFFDNLNPIHESETFMLRYPGKDEIWVCFPNLSSVSGECNEAVIWNYRNNTWTIRDLNSVRSGTIAPVKGGGLPSAIISIAGDSGNAGYTHTGTAEVQSFDITSEVPGFGVSNSQTLTTTFTDPIDDFDFETPTGFVLNILDSEDCNPHPVVRKQVNRITFPDQTYVYNLGPYHGTRLIIQGIDPAQTVIGMGLLGLTADSTRDQYLTALANHINNNEDPALQDFTASIDGADLVMTSDVMGPRRFNSATLTTYELLKNQAVNQSNFAQAVTTSRSAVNITQTPTTVPVNSTATDAYQEELTINLVAGQFYDFNIIVRSAYYIAGVAQGKAEYSTTGYNNSQINLTLSNPNPSLSLTRGDVTSFQTGAGTTSWTINDPGSWVAGSDISSWTTTNELSYNARSVWTFGPPQGRCVTTIGYIRITGVADVTSTITLENISAFNHTGRSDCSGGSGVSSNFGPTVVSGWRWTAVNNQTAGDNSTLFDFRLNVGGELIGGPSDLTAGSSVFYDTISSSLINTWSALRYTDQAYDNEDGIYDGLQASATQNNLTTAVDVSGTGLYGLADDANLPSIQVRMTNPTDVNFPIDLDPFPASATNAEEYRDFILSELLDRIQFQGINPLQTPTPVQPVGALYYTRLNADGDIEFTDIATGGAGALGNTTFTEFNGQEYPETTFGGCLLEDLSALPGAEVTDGNVAIQSIPFTGTQSNQGIPQVLSFTRLSISSDFDSGIPTQTISGNQTDVTARGTFTGSQETVGPTESSYMTQADGYFWAVGDDPNGDESQRTMWRGTIPTGTGNVTWTQVGGQWTAANSGERWTPAVRDENNWIVMEHDQTNVRYTTNGGTTYGTYTVSGDWLGHVIATETGWYRIGRGGLMRYAAGSAVPDAASDWATATTLPNASSDEDRYRLKYIPEAEVVIAYGQNGPNDSSFNTRAPSVLCFQDGSTTGTTAIGGRNAVYGADGDANSICILYTTGAGNRTFRIRRSTDGGSTWSDIAIGGTNTATVNVFTAQGLGGIVNDDTWQFTVDIANQNSMYFTSTDGGATWTGTQHTADLFPDGRSLASAGGQSNARIGTQFAWLANTGGTGNGGVFSLGRQITGVPVANWSFDGNGLDIDNQDFDSDIGRAEALSEIKAHLDGLTGTHAMTIDTDTSAGTLTITYDTDIAVSTNFSIDSEVGSGTGTKDTDSTGSAGSGIETVYTVTSPYGETVDTELINADSDEVVQALITAIQSLNPASDVEYRFTAVDSEGTLVLTSDEFGPVSGMWSITADNQEQTMMAGDFSFSATEVDDPGSFRVLPAATVQFAHTSGNVYTILTGSDIDGGDIATLIAESINAGGVFDATVSDNTLTLVRHTEGFQDDIPVLSFLANPVPANEFTLPTFTQTLGSSPDATVLPVISVSSPMGTIYSVDLNDLGISDRNITDSEIASAVKAQTDADNRWVTDTDGGMLTFTNNYREPVDGNWMFTVDSYGDTGLDSESFPNLVANVDTEGVLAQFATPTRVTIEIQTGFDELGNEIREVFYDAYLGKGPGLFYDPPPGYPLQNDIQFDDTDSVTYLSRFWSPYNPGSSLPNGTSVALGDVMDDIIALVDGSDRLTRTNRVPSSGKPVTSITVLPTEYSQLANFLTLVDVEVGTRAPVLDMDPDSADPIPADSEGITNPLVDNSVVETGFDPLRPWPTGQLNPNRVFPVFAQAGLEDSDTERVQYNRVAAADIGYTWLGVPYVSHVERHNLAMSPEFETEQLSGLALWANSGTVLTFGEDPVKANLSVRVAGSNTPDALPALIGSVPEETRRFQTVFDIDSDYKVDLRINGRFGNYRIDDADLETVDTDGLNVYNGNNNTNWRLSGMQLDVSKRGTR